MKRVRRVPGWYGGCLLEIGCHDVVVYARDGQMLGRMPSVRAARVLIRSHRRATRATA